jgi:hypothetical protein
MTVVRFDLERQNAAVLDQVRELRNQNKVLRQCTPHLSCFETLGALTSHIMRFCVSSDLQEIPVCCVTVDLYIQYTSAYALHMWVAASERYSRG